MASSDALWHSPDIQALVEAKAVGPLLRHIREVRGMTQQALAKEINASTSTVSRLEGKKFPDMGYTLTIARILSIPGEILGAALGLDMSRSSTVPVTGNPADPEADPIRRREFLFAGLVLPAALMQPLDEALAGGQNAGPTDLALLATRISTVRQMYDRGENRAVIACLPDLLTAARAGVKTGDPDRMVQFCKINDLATDVLDKIGDVSSAHATAQSSVLVAEWTDDPLVMAAANRGLSIVLRHEGKYPAAVSISRLAAETVEQTGVVTLEQARVYAQALCTYSYVAAENDDRPAALQAVREAHRIAALVEQRTDRATTIPTSIAGMYEVSVRWALGDAGSAIEAGNRVNVASLPTAERRARFHTDMARAWWARKRPEEAAVALLDAHIEAPQEVTDRPRIRAITDELTTRHRKLNVVGILTERLAS